MHFYLAARTIDGFYKGGPSKRLKRVFSVQLRIDEWQCLALRAMFIGEDAKRPSRYTYMI